MLAAGGGQRAMAAPIWRGIDRVVVECDAVDATVRERLCAAALAAARGDGALPVVAGPQTPPRRGDAIVRVRGLDGAIEAGVARALEIDESEAAMPPLTVPLASTGDAALVRAIDAAFGRLLPWRRAAANSKAPPRSS